MKPFHVKHLSWIFLILNTLMIPCFAESSFDPNESDDYHRGATGTEMEGLPIGSLDPDNENNFTRHNGETPEEMPSDIEGRPCSFDYQCGYSACVHPGGAMRGVCL